MKRREFINWVGLGCLASSLPVALAACSPEKTTTASSGDSTTASTSVTSTTSNSAPNWQKVGTVAELDKTGQLLVKESPAGAILVVGTSKAAKNLIAVNPTCTHKGCTVGWKADKNLFVCPCHDAEYSGDGKVQEGPATKPLKTFSAKIEGNSVFVKAT